MYPGWSNRSWTKAIIMVKVFLTMEVLRCFRSSLIRTAYSIKSHQHTCQFYVFWAESPSFSSHRNLLPRRLKSPSFEPRRCFPSTQSSSSSFAVPQWMTISCQRSNSHRLSPSGANPARFLPHINPCRLRCCHSLCDGLGLLRRRFTCTFDSTTHFTSSHPPSLIV